MTKIGKNKNNKNIIPLFTISSFPTSIRRAYITDTSTFLLASVSLGPLPIITRAFVPMPPPPLSPFLFIYSRSPLAILIDKNHPNGSIEKEFSLDANLIENV